jgi:hypothetical protein
MRNGEGEIEEEQQEQLMLERLGLEDDKQPSWDRKDRWHQKLSCGEQMSAPPDKWCRAVEQIE